MAVSYTAVQTLTNEDKVNTISQKGFSFTRLRYTFHAQKLY